MLIVEWLLSQPAIDLNPVDHDGETPLMWAVKMRNLKAVKALLRKHVNPEISNKDNRTPLHEALSAQHPDNEIVLSLLRHGAGIYGVDNLQQTPVDILFRKVFKVVVNTAVESMDLNFFTLGATVQSNGRILHHQESDLLWRFGLISPEAYKITTGTRSAPTNQSPYLKTPSYDLTEEQLMANIEKEFECTI
ncbi:putative ankyrin repeat protein FPV231 like protein [Argiope bruennichi]|uniref:Alpha-latrotoxin n=1 Tax=Argiope bruennichi TaxID=94029 RepID=A0A8T0E9Z3_ARGBR|nr:putative ankyrin repeat protein FPV231 like protein [Argiope bruennichi]